MQKNRGRRTNRLTHLHTYADDTPILYEAEKDQLLHHRGVLLACEVVSGLKVNLAKSTVFSINAEHCSDDLAGIMSCEVEQLPTTYLAQPLGAKRMIRRCGSMGDRSFGQVQQ